MEREQELNAAVSGRRHAFDSDLTDNALFVLLVRLGVTGRTYRDILSGDYGTRHHSAASGSLSASRSANLI